MLIYVQLFNWYREIDMDKNGPVDYQNTRLLYFATQMAWRYIEGFGPAATYSKVKLYDYMFSSHAYFHSFPGMFNQFNFNHC